MSFSGCPSISAKVFAGKIKQVTDPAGTYGFAYDNMGRLIGTTTQYSFLPGITYSNVYGYDAASDRTSFNALRTIRRRSLGENQHLLGRKCEQM